MGAAVALVLKPIKLPNGSPVTLKVWRRRLPSRPRR